MDEIFGIPTPLLFGQLLLGLINGAFYAMLSLGLAVIFGLLNIINFTHITKIPEHVTQGFPVLNIPAPGPPPAFPLAFPWKRPLKGP